MGQALTACNGDSRSVDARQDLGVHEDPAQLEAPCSRIGGSGSLPGFGALLPEDQDLTLQPEEPVPWTSVRPKESPDSEADPQDRILVEDRELDGGKYTGQVLQRTMEPDGQGEFVKESDTYRGAWRKGRRHGRGTWNGAGPFETYDGEWAHGEREGTGVATKGLVSYDGGWLGDLQHGFGEERLVQDGGEVVTFKGAFAHGERSGPGEAATSSCKLAGQWHKGQIHGKGHCRWADKVEYTGQWNAGRIEGEGCMLWPGGARYDGQFAAPGEAADPETGGRASRHGFGSMTWPNGRVCQGQWHHGQLHGTVTLITKVGQKREARFVHGKEQ